ncbi:MAG TPA: response regulator transcription factor [Streptosporangiaceae bacterium]|nr:response regulator transcription factor [Streptosporangiaceae bacterium]
MRILIAEDHTLLRDMLAELLAVENDLEVVGTTGDGDHAVELAAALHPDIVLLDVSMPGGPVTSTVQRLITVCPGVAVVILTMHDDPRRLSELLAAGSRAYLHKSVSRERLISVLRSVMRDGSQIEISTPARSAPAGPDDKVPLSDRECEVLELVARAMSNRQIAGRLHISEAMTKRHIRSVFKKLGAVSRLDAVNKAVAAEIIAVPDREVAASPPPARLSHRRPVTLKYPAKDR